MSSLYELHINEPMIFTHANDDLVRHVCFHLENEDLYILSIVNKNCKSIAKEVYNNRALRRSSSKQSRNFLIRPKFVFLYNIKYADFFLRTLSKQDRVVKHLVSQAAFLYGSLEVVRWFFATHKKDNKLVCLRHLVYHLINLDKKRSLDCIWLQKKVFLSVLIQEELNRLKDAIEYLCHWYESNIEGFSAKYDFNNAFASTPQMVFKAGRDRFEGTEIFNELREDMTELETLATELAKL